MSAKNAGGDVEFQTRQENQGAEGDGVLHDRGDGSKGLDELGDGERNGEDVVANRNIDLQLVGVEEDRAARFDLRGVALDGVLVQARSGH